MAFLIDGLDIADFAEIDYTWKLNTKISTFFNGGKVKVLSLTNNSKTVADAPPGYNWTSNFLDSRFIYNNTVYNASRKGCRPQFREKQAFSSNGSYSLRITGSGNNHNLVINNGSSDYQITSIGNRTSAYCYALIQAPGGGGGDCWTGVGGNAGGGGGSGGSGIFLINVYASNPISIELGSNCTIGSSSDRHYILRGGGGGGPNSYGGGGSCTHEKSWLSYYFWELATKSGASGGNKGAGSTVSSMSTANSTPDTFTTSPGSAGSMGSGSGGGGGGSTLGSGGTGGGGNGTSGGTGAGGGGGSYHFTSKRYGGSGGSAYLKIYY